MPKNTTNKPKPRGQTARKSGDKGVNLIAAAIIFIFIILLSYLIYNSLNKKDTDKPGDVVEITFWYMNAATNKWDTEIHKIKKDEQTEMIRQALQEWLAGPKSESLLKSVPSYISASDLIEGVKFDDVTQIVEITFSEAYNDMNNADGAICYGSLARTLTSFDFISGVNFYVGEAALVSDYGRPIGVLDGEGTITNGNEIPIDDSEVKTITLYFADAQGMGLLPETRDITVNPKQALEKYIVEELIKGPKEEGHYPVFSPDIKLRPIKTDEGLCYVDFTSDFIKKFEGGSTAESMLIYAIVNSLTELPHIKKVQILVEGDRVSEAKGFSMDLSKTYERDENYLIK